MKNPMWELMLILTVIAGIAIIGASLSISTARKQTQEAKPAVPPEIEQGPVNVVFTNRQILGRGTNQYGEWVLSLHTNTPILTNVHAHRFAPWSLPVAVSGSSGTPAPKLVQARECTNCGFLQGRYFYAEEWKP